MGRVHIFSRKGRRRAQAIRRLRDLAILAPLAAVLVQPDVRTQITSAAAAVAGAAGSGGVLTCTSVRVIDGDTLDCAGMRIRLSGIDAPEMPGHRRRGRDCVQGDPHAARAALQALAAGGLTCRPQGLDHYGRVLARCAGQGRDAGCALIAGGHAEARYSRIRCT